MKLGKLVFLVTCLSLLSISLLRAEEKQYTQDQIVGAWMMEGSSIKIGGKMRYSNQVWKFTKDGKLNSAGSDRRVGNNMSVNVNYELKGATLIHDQAGRPGKKLSYKIIELDDEKMTLRGGGAGYLFFTKRKGR